MVWKLAALAAGLVAVLTLAGNAASATTPLVHGGKLLPPYKAVVAGEPLTCLMHIYKDGLIVRCMRLKGAA